MEDFVEQYGSDTLSGYGDMTSFVASLERPRKIMLMVKAGTPVDAVISELISLLEVWDIIIDGGNSHYMDAERRVKMLWEKGIEYVGCGVSGGEEWALHGPSIMPGCSREVWMEVAPFFTEIAARDFEWGACVTHIGTGGAGNYVKTIHNGIEYAVMQMIAETYDAFRTVYHLSAPEIADIFARYDEWVLDSYLMEISAQVLRRQDTETAGYLIDSILDVAWAKGTGLWSSIDALESGMAASSIVESTFARMISWEKSLRTKLASLYVMDVRHGDILPLAEFEKKMEHTLYIGMLLAYAQWLSLIARKSDTNNWWVDMAEVTRIWQGGCIIRSQMLAFLTDAYVIEKDVKNILLLTPVHDAIISTLVDYQDILSLFVSSGLPTPALSASLEYFYQMTRASSSANMIQWLRDYFWAHTYARTDKEWVFHTDWIV